MTAVGEKALERVLLAAAFISGSMTASIFGFMLWLGLPLLKGGHFFYLIVQPWAPHLGQYGILPMIVGSLAIASLSLVFAFPISLGCASFISVLGPQGLRRLLRKAVEFMTGVPTVIYGFVGIFVLVPFIRELFQKGSGMCVLSAALMLTLLVAPTMILFFCDSFDRVPRSYLDAVDALGGTQVQKFLYVILPGGRRGLAAGLSLSLGRALGDTLIALMIAGNAVRAPQTALDPARTLTSHIALVFAADYESLEFKAIFACGITLYLLTTILVLWVRLCARPSGKVAT